MKTKKIYWIKILYIVSGLFFLGSIVGTLGLVFLIIWFSGDLPNPNNVIRREGFVTRIYDRNDKVLYDLYKDTRRVTVTASDVPESLKQAVVAIEDKDFYSHRGFDPLTLVRIPYNVVFKRRLVGGSTLTQQLVKNAVLETTERSVSRKVREFILAVTIDAKFSKDDILLMYLNEAPYGGPNWGAGTASEVYFDKPLSKISLAESVILAGIPQRPNVFFPFSKTPKAYIERSKTVLDRMVDDKYISKELSEKTFEEVKNYKFATNKTTLEAPHFVFWIRDWLVRNYGENVVDLGLKVKTTLDLEMQEKMQKIVAEQVEKAEKLDVSNGAMLVLDPRDGQILSMVGSRDYYSDKTDGQVNVVTRPRQPGSSIKPVVYLLGIKKGLTQSSLLIDAPVTLPVVGQKDYSPKNYNGKFLGPISLSKALGNSINTTAVKMVANYGVEPMLSLAYSMGINSLEPSENNLKNLGYSVSLGGGEVKMLELAGAYSSFANGGYRIDPVGVLQVEDRSGRVLYSFKAANDIRVMTEQEAFLVNNILSENKNREITFGAKNGLQISGYQVAAKTGTTNDKRDNWAIGWTPNILVAAWVGNNDNKPMGKIASGVSGATPIWREAMLSLVTKREKQDFAIPAGIIRAEVDAVSGYPSHDNFPTEGYYFINGSLSGAVDPIHKKLKVCKEAFGLAPPLDVSRGEFVEKEYIKLQESDPVSSDGKNRWQEGIESWISNQPADAQQKYKVPSDFCRSGGLISLGFATPNPRSTVGNEFEVSFNINSLKKIVEIKVFANGQEKLSLTDPLRGKINLADGVYRLKAIAKDRDGNTQENEIEIGVNKPWDWTPSPTVTPAVTP